MGATQLTCRECGTDYALEARYVCERCFGPLEVGYEHRVDDVEHVRRRIQGGPQNIWRYHDFLPLEGPQPPDAHRPARGLHAARARRPPRRRLGLREVWVKNDAANPTHSFKDRVVSVATHRARELGFGVLACASTGNLANSVAAHGAALGLETYVFIPADLEEQKVLATGVYGTSWSRSRAPTTTSTGLCTELSGERDWAFVNVNMRPYYAEGSKTLAYEIAEQLGWELPDRVVAPIASGSLYTKIAKGFEEFLEPRARARRRAGHERRAGRRLLAGGDGVRGGRRLLQAGAADTIAKSLAIGNPADGPYALELARAAAARSTRSPTTRSARASACWPRRRASSPRPPAA
jgi:threonine synthase